MHININAFTVGMKGSGVYIVASHSVKPTKNGTSYLDIVLSDKTGTINGKMWTIPAHINPNTDIIDGYFIAVAFVVEDYMGKLQMKIENIKPITDESQVNKQEIVPCAPLSIDKMWSKIMIAVNDIGNPILQKLCMDITLENKEAFTKCPGAKSMHHAEISGLLHHVTGMLDIGLAIAELYPNVNRDLLVTGIILHDICKPREFALGPIGLCTDYTRSGKLLGHLAMGASYVEKKCNEIGAPAEITELLMHMLLSHHGKPEFGSAVRPMFLEAILLNMIDDMDAKMNMASQALEGIPEGSFTERLFGMENVQLYKHTLKNEA